MSTSTDRICITIPVEHSNPKISIHLPNYFKATRLLCKSRSQKHRNTTIRRITCPNKQIQHIPHALYTKNYAMNPPQVGGTRDLTFDRRRSPFSAAPRSLRNSSSATLPGGLHLDASQKHYLRTTSLGASHHRTGVADRCKRKVRTTDRSSVHG